MLVGILVSTLFVLAHAQYVDYYAEYADAIDALQDQLEQQILSMDGDIPDIRDPRRHYAVLVTYIAMVANGIANAGVNDSTLTVDLKLLPQIIDYALNNVQDVIDQTAIAIQSVNNDTKKIRSLLETLCPPSQKYVVCDQIVSQAIEDDPDRYRNASNIMNLMGQSAQMLLKDDLIAVAEKYEEVEYLLVNRNNLLDIIDRVIYFITLDSDM